MSLDRRQLIKATTLAVAGSTSWGKARGQAPRQHEPASARPLIISTWKFGLPGNELALRVIQRSGSTLDGVEQGIRLIESSGNGSVGLSGGPNAAGFVQLDACLMHGPGQRAGSVAAIEGIRHPITAARRVMEKTRHVMLVGEGARLFALEHGLERVDVADHGDKLRAWQEQKRRESATTETEAAATSGGGKEDHDTMTMLVLGADGTISGGCSTSGLGGKLPGRVGDSPIVGSGLYVDNEIGAAGATGLGEIIMRYCASFLIVELMRTGLHPAEACRQAIARMARTEPRGKRLEVNFIALDKQGRFGAAGGPNFPYSVSYPGFSRVLKP